MPVCFYSEGRVSKSLAKHLALSLLFETLENIPLFLGGILAVWWGLQGQLGQAAIAAALGSVLGALAIHFGEAQQSPGFHSTWRKTFFNFVAFVVCTTVAWLYFSVVPGGSWDFLAGAGLGLLLSVLESPSFTTRLSWWRHAGSMAVATSLGVVLARQLVSLPTLTDVVTATLGVTLVLSVLIAVIEYWPQWHQLRPKSSNSTERV